MVKRLLDYFVRVFLLFKHKHILLLKCPYCDREVFLTLANMRQIILLNRNFLISPTFGVCLYCEQEFEFDKSVLIEHTFTDKSLRQALYGHYMEGLPPDLLSEFKIYCDEHPSYDWKHVESTFEKIKREFGKQKDVVNKGGTTK